MLDNHSEKNSIKAIEKDKFVKVVNKSQKIEHIFNFLGKNVYCI